MRWKSKPDANDPGNFKYLRDTHLAPKDDGTRTRQSDRFRNITFGNEQCDSSQRISEVEATESRALQQDTTARLPWYGLTSTADGWQVVKG